MVTAKIFINKTVYAAVKSNCADLLMKFLLNKKHRLAKEKKTENLIIILTEDAVFCNRDFELVLRNGSIVLFE